jgi:hypothetical protein
MWVNQKSSLLKPCKENNFERTHALHVPCLLSSALFCLYSQTLLTSSLIYVEELDVAWFQELQIKAT